MGQAARSHANDFVIEELNRVLNLDYDAIKAYEAAIERLHDPSYQSRLESFKQDHVRHTQNLAAIVSEYGGEPASHADVKSVLTQGKVVIGNIVGDLGVLKAMNSNERVTNGVYEQALSKLASKPDIVRVLKENLTDERRHKDWIEQALKAS
ncbi:ferritin-like domain-containing protein [Proteobacteria bacterium 005FR1]|nr:ferritin-like domain-containing protein [Proteobacteria bacterium 005FR1]